MLVHPRRLPQAGHQPGTRPGGGGLRRERGARAIEAYPITTTNVIDEELHVGTVSVFAGAGLTEIGRPTRRRMVMRLEL